MKFGEDTFFMNNIYPKPDKWRAIKIGHFSVLLTIVKPGDHISRLVVVDYSG
jgi:hypothetical protein